MSKINEGQNYLQLQKRYMRRFLRVHHQMSSQSARSAHVLQVIDSDFDEDDEYQQCEIDEIFSISPTAEEFCDFDHARDASEFESEDDAVVPVGTGSAGICDDEDDEEDTLVRKSAADAIMNMTTRETIDRVIGMKDKQAYIRSINNCDECKNSLINISKTCPRHGHYD